MSCRCVVATGVSLELRGSSDDPAGYESIEGNFAMNPG